MTSHPIIVCLCCLAAGASLGTCFGFVLCALLAERGGPPGRWE
jgi:hypothetical protein